MARRRCEVEPWFVSIPTIMYSLFFIILTLSASSLATLGRELALVSQEGMEI